MSGRSAEAAGTVFRTRVLLVVVVLIAIGSSEPILAVEASRHSDGCRVRASTRRSEAGRDPERRTTCARVDNRPSPHFLQPPRKKHERPIDRLRSRGEGRPKASGDKGARRQINRNSHSRHPQWRW
jgi:hypothetical protein